MAEEKALRFETMTFAGDRPVHLEGRGGFELALETLRGQLSERFTARTLQRGGPRVQEEARKLAAAVHKEYLNRTVREHLPPLPGSREAFIDRALSYTFRLGPIDHLLEDESVEDIAVNGPNEVMVYRKAWERTEITFPDRATLLNILNTALAKAERSVNRVKPIADAAVDDSRFSVVVQPVAVPDPTAVIRIPRHAGIDLVDLVRPWPRPGPPDPPTGPGEARDNSRDVGRSPLPDYPDLPLENILNKPLAAYLHGAVLAGLSIAVIGPTGVGKTALITALGRCLPRDSRVLIIEDTPEIQLYPEAEVPHNVLRLQTRPPSLEEVPPVTPADLVQLALRQRPDALTLSEARGKEVFDLLNALYTGHSNGLTTFHAYGLHEMYSRLAMMIAQSERGRHLRMRHVAQIIATALDIVVVLEKEGDHRRVRAVGELAGKVESAGGEPRPAVEILFRYSGGRAPRLDGPLRESAHAARLAEAGVPGWAYTAP